MIHTLPAGADAVQKLLFPIKLQTFFDEYWQRRPLVINRADAHYFDPLLTVDDLDTLIATTPLPVARVNMGADAVGIPPERYTAFGDQGDGMYINPADVMRLHRQGNTIILRTMHLFMHSLAAFCRDIETFFQCNAQANIYMTPAGTQSSFPHWDAHDIFVIQIAGSKVWRLHEAPMQQPLYTYQFNRERHPIGEQTGEFTLHAGDIAYVPRGLAHDPVATGYSVHIALGVLVRTWADVFAAMFESVIKNDIACRAALPVNHGCGFDVEACATQFPALAAKFLDPTAMRAALAGLSDEFLGRRRGDTRGMLTHFASGAAVTLASIVEIPENAPAIIQSRNGNCRALFNGVELQADVSVLPALVFIRQRRRVRVDSIPAESDAERIALVEHLLIQGALRLCETQPR
jgi:ribosomal protein L16 Arg81 hydroxylase